MKKPTPTPIPVMKFGDSPAEVAKKKAMKAAVAKKAAAKNKSKDMTTGKKPFYGFDGNPMGYKGPIE
jgi:hypothetical protein